jgi:hypothetical protein
VKMLAVPCYRADRRNRHAGERPASRTTSSPSGTAALRLAKKRTVGTWVGPVLKKMAPLLSGAKSERKYVTHAINVR